MQMLISWSKFEHGPRHGGSNEYPLAIAIYVGMICSSLKLDLLVICQLGWDECVKMSWTRRRARSKTNHRRFERIIFRKFHRNCKCTLCIRCSGLQMIPTLILSPPRIVHKKAFLKRPTGPVIRTFHIWRLVSSGTTVILAGGVDISTASS